MGLRTESVDSGIGQRSLTTTPDSPRGASSAEEPDPIDELSTTISAVPKDAGGSAVPFAKAVLAISAGDTDRCCVCHADASAICGACESACCCGKKCQVRFCVACCKELGGCV